MPKFDENPILNSPYLPPKQHWRLDADRRPTGEVQEGRRPSRHSLPVPAAVKKQRQDELDITEDAEINKVGRIREEVNKWRALPPEKQNVTSVTEKLLTYWREQKATPPLFYCQIEAAETLIWLNEVAPHTNAGKEILEFIKTANAEANPLLFRLAAKMATGAGKTTVMAMLIAYHAINKARRPQSDKFADHFLIITPGITIKDRLRVLLPQDPENYYEKREIVPYDMREELKKSHIIITNYHAFKLRETRELTKKQREVLRGNSKEELPTLETEGQMLARVSDKLLRAKNVVVINDEAHHCYRHKTDEEGADESQLDTDEKEEAKRDNEAARLWINGIESLGRKTKLCAVYDLSATPFFLRGSGYPEGLLFPWVASDFSLMEAIECGIVKLPRVPVKDGAFAKDQLPIYRNLYAHISKKLPHSRRNSGGETHDPRRLPSQLLGALKSLYEHYEKVYESWKSQPTPPVYIVICNNTATSKLVYDYVSGWEAKKDRWRRGELELFSNVDEDGRLLARPHTLLVDSYQLESGGGLDDKFKKAAAAEIAVFKEEYRKRHPDRDVGKITDADILREVMNTVGKTGRLGEQIRCVVSVSMLTEGWDANNVTHILGIRKFGTQLLCEQAVGRALRRLSYDFDGDKPPEPEYADIFGIPFEFAQGSRVKPPPPPPPTTRVRRLDERNELEISFPRVVGYKVRPPETRLTAKFDKNAHLSLKPEMAPPKVEQRGIIGRGEMMTLDALKARRENEVVYHLAAHTAQKHFAEKDGNVAPARFRDLVPIVREWMDNYLVCLGGTFPQYLLWITIADLAAERIYRACVKEEGEEKLLPVTDTFNPEGSTHYVDFLTRRKADSLHKTRADKSHINYAVCDSSWEMAFCKMLEDDEGVFAYARTDGMGFEAPYEHGNKVHGYRPDFVVLVDDGRGRDDLLNLVVEIKGYRNGYAQAKADTMNSLWIPAVNNESDRWGRWAFVEIMDMQEAREKLGEFTAAARRRVV